MSRCLAALVLIAWFTLPASGQQLKPVVPFEGTQAFRHILQIFKLEPVEGLDQLTALPPDETLVIFFGRLEIFDELAGRKWKLKRFLDQGGAALVASDYPEPRRLQDVGIQLSAAHVNAPGDTGFKGWSECPIISPREVIVQKHPIFKDLKAGIATNRPVSLTLTAGFGLVPYAKYPPGSLSLSRPTTPGLMAAGSPLNPPPRGRIVVLAGHGLFVNGMMAQHEVDNFAFAWQCVRWLSERGNGPRRKSAFLVEDGILRSDFNVPLTELPPLPIPPTRVVNQIIRGIEEEDLVNRVVHENLSREEILQGMMILLSVGLVVVAARKLFKTRYRLDTSAPLLAPSLEKALSDVPVLSQRHRTLLLQGNLFEAAQMLAQLWFERHTPAEQLHEIAQRPPSIHIKGNWWQRRTLGRRTRALWNLAFGETARAISRKEFQRLMDSVERLGAAHERGELRIAKV